MSESKISKDKIKETYSVCLPGSFDPITLGHLEIIKRLARQFERIVVLVSNNAEKQYLFTQIERLEMVKLVCKNLPNVEVKTTNGLTVEFAKNENISLLARGIRNIADLQYEQNLYNFNQTLDGSIDTIYLIADHKFLFISSKNIKELIKNNVQMDAFLPKEIIKQVIAKVKSAQIVKN